MGLEFEVICDNHDEMIPKGIVGVGRTEEEAFHNAELALDRLCADKGYDIILYGPANRVTRVLGRYYVVRDAKFIKRRS